jgi:hypothetical protein
MSIGFHCEHCGKRIEAPDDAGGKWGKCPCCHNKVYVPSKQPDEEMRLAPLDAEDERRKRQLLAEEARLRQDIMKETEVPEEGAQVKNQASAAQPGALSDAELMTSIIAYLRQMADGELEAAEETAKTIIPCGSRAVRILERVALSGLPEPEIADIPQQVLSGLIKKLRSRLR